MAKANGTRRNPGIMAGFDKAALRRHVETADQRRAPTQEELAAGYGADDDIMACARDYPASVDDIVEDICAQDPRFLDQGRKLLKQLLRSNAKGSTDTGRKRRGRETGRLTEGPVRQKAGGSAVSSEGASAQVVFPPPTAPSARRCSTPPITATPTSTETDPGRSMTLLRQTCCPTRSGSQRHRFRIASRTLTILFHSALANLPTAGLIPGSGSVTTAVPKRRWKVGEEGEAGWTRLTGSGGLAALRFLSPDDGLEA